MRMRHLDLLCPPDTEKSKVKKKEFKGIEKENKEMSEAGLEVANASLYGFNPKRKLVEQYILDKVKILDTSGINTKFYTDLFASYSDKQFHTWMTELQAGRTQLVFWAPNMKVKVRMEDILKIAEQIGVQLFQRLKLWDTTTKRYFKTPKRYLILRLPVRRLKQYLQSKISVPESDTTVDLFTGQVIKPDKGSAISLVEAQTLYSKGLTSGMTEFLNVRGGNIKAYASFKSQLEETGSGRMSDLDNGTRVRSAEVVNAFFTSMLIKSTF
jgi:hypothetical protein